MSFRVLDASPCAVGASASAGDTGAPLRDSGAEVHVTRVRVALMSPCVEDDDPCDVEACVHVAGATIQVREVFAELSVQ
jgi:hypothetical protein